MVVSESNDIIFTKRYSDRVATLKICRFFTFSFRTVIEMTVKIAGKFVISVTIGIPVNNTVTIAFGENDVNRIREL
jgi:hypothetical protein